MRRRAHAPLRRSAAPQATDPLAALRDQGHKAITRGDLGGTEAAYLKAIELGLRDADVYNNLACIHDRTRVEPDRVKDLFRLALQLRPNSTEFRNNLGDFLRRQAMGLTGAGRFREALPLYQERAELLGQSAPAHGDLGYCHYRLGNMDDAAKHLVQAINLDPTNARYYDDLGMVFLDTNHMAEAQGALQEALRLDPQSVDTLSHLGLLANLAGLTGVAVKFFQRALAINADVWTLHNNLAMVYREQGELRLCREHYQHALRLEPKRQDLYSAYLLSLNSDPQADPAWVSSQHRRFETLAESPVRVVRPSDRNPHRDAWYSEKLVRAAGGFLAYQPLDESGQIEIPALPAAAAGHVTFGSFNNWPSSTTESSMLGPPFWPGSRTAFSCSRRAACGTSRSKRASPRPLPRVESMPRPGCVCCPTISRATTI